MSALARPPTGCGIVLQLTDLSLGQNDHLIGPKLRGKKADKGNVWDRERP